MTREQVKKELKDLKSIIILNKQGIDVIDTKGLKHKYEKAISNLEHIEQVIFVELVFNKKTYLALSIDLNYSEEGIRKKWNKIIDKLANMLEIKRTNFDRITSSVESFIKWVLDTYQSVPEQLKCQTSCNKDCGECFKEWLQKEF